MVINKINTTMHKHGKWFFGFLSVALVVSLGYGLSGRSCAGPKSEVGKSFGEDFTYSDLNKIHRYMQIVNSLRAGFVVRQDYNEDGYISLLARSRAADKLGIFVSDEDLEKALKSFPQFKTSNEFDSKKFDSFVNGTLKKAKISGKDVDKALKFWLKNIKVATLFASNVPMTASDDQLKVLYRYLYSDLTVTSYTFDRKDYVKDLKVDNKAIDQYFVDNKDKYPKPKLATFDYAVISYKKFANEANKNLKEKDLKDYYDRNKELFVKNPTATKEKTEYKPFDMVKSEIRKRLIKENSKKAANDAALRFFNSLYQEIDVAQKQRIDIFAKMAKEQGLTVVSEKKVRIDGLNYKGAVPQNMLKIIDETNIDTTYAVEVVEGSADNDGKFFVAVIAEKEAAEIAEKMSDLPKDIQQKIKEDYIVKESLMLARADAAKVYKAITEDKEFDKTSKVNVKKLEPFNLMSSMTKRFENMGLITTLSVPTVQGKFSKLENKANFGAIFVKVNKRMKPDMKKFAAQKPMLKMFNHSVNGSSAVGRQLSPGEVLFGEWLQDNSSLYRVKK